MISTGKLLEKSRILEKVFYKGTNGSEANKVRYVFESLVKH
jgi:hypothetical protein